jgi:hypothetical protein
MRKAVEIEDIEQMRQAEGIDDAELRDEVRQLQPGDLVNLTLLPVGKSLGGETLVVRITNRQGHAFRGKLVSRPTSPQLAHVAAGRALTFTTTHIHSVPKGPPSAGRGPRKKGKRASPAQPAPDAP